MKRRQARRFGIPLVPADEHADPAVARVPGLEAQISGSEVELFVVERIVRDVHLAILAQVGAVGIDDGRRIVVHSGRAALEQRRDQHNFEFTGQ